MIYTKHAMTLYEHLLDFDIQDFKPVSWTYTETEVEVPSNFHLYYTLSNDGHSNYVVLRSDNAKLVGFCDGQKTAEEVVSAFERFTS